MDSSSGRPRRTERTSASRARRLSESGVTDDQLDRTPPVIDRDDVPPASQEASTGQGVGGAPALRVRRVGGAPVCSPVPWALRAAHTWRSSQRSSPPGRTRWLRSARLRAAQVSQPIPQAEHHRKLIEEDAEAAVAPAEKFERGSALIIEADAQWQQQAEVANGHLRAAGLRPVDEMPAHSGIAEIARSLARHDKPIPPAAPHW